MALGGPQPVAAHSGGAPCMWGAGPRGQLRFRSSPRRPVSHAAGRGTTKVAPQCAVRQTTVSKYKGILKASKEGKK